MEKWLADNPNRTDEEQTAKFDYLMELEIEHLNLLINIRNNGDSDQEA